MPRAYTDIKAVVFDIGGVLLDWDPRNLYRKLIDDPAAIESFLTECGIDAWNVEMDMGLNPDRAIADLSARFPARAPLIAAWKDRWLEMIKGPMTGTVDVMRRLKDRGVPLYSITNFNDRMFKVAAARFDFLNWFDGIVISAEEKLLKPNPAIYNALLSRYDLKAETLYFTDDRPENIEAARTLGFHADVFVSGAQLEDALCHLNVLS